MLGQPTGRIDFQRHEKSRRARPSSTVGISGLDVGSSTMNQTYTAPGSNLSLSSSDPRSVGYDVEARYGRGRAEREQRKRKQDELEERVSNLQASQVSRPVVAEPAPSSTLQASDDVEAKFFSEVDQNSLAAKTLRIAQATLRGDPKPRRGKQHAESTESSAPSSSTSRLLARHEAKTSSLPEAKLKTKRFRSNVLDRPGSAGQQARAAQAEEDGFVII